MKTYVKICCMASREEAALAMSMGADALGLVSAMPSGPGPIADELIADIAATVPPPIATFLLTCRQDAEGIIEQHALCRTSTLQLVDTVAPAELRKLRVRLPGIKLVQVIHVGGEFYFKGEAESRVWLSPHDETPVQPHDVAPEEIDVAIAIDRLQAVVDWPVAAVERKWAGLRSFAPDRIPVLGADPRQPDFFWCAGQGGFGIQTAPAVAALLAEQLGGRPADGAIGRVDPAPFAAARFR